ncbi:molybdate ABC transporter substrate-binding protein [Stella sp.]|uniref:molybdate ABC transporter substrate-binding protein n=1 Tax=Stella sp. TaxID=2912054 RepID=UPI0035AF4DC7
MRRRLLVLATWAVAAATLLPPAAASAQGVVVFAAASMKNALDEAVAAWTARGGVPAKVSYAASSALARQIEQGAPASIFLSADLDWMDYVEKRNLIRPESRANLLANAIVLIAPRDSTAAGPVAPGLDLAKLLGADGRIAVGQVESVPAGKYGKAALETLGLWPQVANRLAQTENVRAALLLVARGETPLGIVYATDAAADAARVRVVGAFPPDSHPPIIYPIALTREAVPAAAGLLAWLRSAEAAPHFERQGFRRLP